MRYYGGGIVSSAEKAGPDPVHAHAKNSLDLTPRVKYIPFLRPRLVLAKIGFRAAVRTLRPLPRARHQGPESEKLKLMYAAYDLSGVVPSEERSRSSSGRKASGTGGGLGGGKPKMFRRSKYLTVEDITTVLASASEGAYPTLLQFTAEGGNDNHLSGGGSRNGSPDRSARGESNRADRPGSRGRLRSGEGEAKRSPSQDARAARDPEALAEVLQELARRNAASYAARAVSEFGQVQDGALTQKEFERWALTAPVLRCRINEFSIDVNVAPFQGVRLA